MLKYVARTRIPYRQPLALLLWMVIAISSSTGATETPINRNALISKHDPQLHTLDPSNPLTLGNGKFAFTADASGLQSFPDLYFSRGTPIETKARWAWHSHPNTKGHTLRDANESYDAYQRKVDFPTNMQGAAGQWLRQNPHDLPLARIALTLDTKPLKVESIKNIHQQLSLWNGHLNSSYTLDDVPVSVNSAVHGERDLLAANIQSALINGQRLAIDIHFPRGYRLDKKNTPDINFGESFEHSSTLIKLASSHAIFKRQVDNSEHYVTLHWSEGLELIRVARHHYRLRAFKAAANMAITVEFKQTPSTQIDLKSNATANSRVADTLLSAQTFWRDYWQQGAILSFDGSSHPQANELERRVVLSQYLMAAQEQADIPAQETGLTSSSWYGKHHTEMSWWHTAHWITWNRPRQAERVLSWYQQRLPEAKKLAASRGLTGARWAKMVSPDGRESPGGNPLIIWNQPQAIHLAEMLYQHSPTTENLQRYAQLVEETAQAMSSMLVWQEKHQQFSLLPPIWIAQEIYDPRTTANPSFELSYWRYGLETAQQWRTRLGKAPNSHWQHQLQHLAALPQKDGKYVAIASLPDTFDNIASRRDHPTMLAPWGLLHDPTVDPVIMKRTLHAVLSHWDWKEKIWGWDYPLIAMTSMKLGDNALALDILLKDAPHNHYLTNGHCPQPGARLPVYLPANGALLSAVAQLVDHWKDNPVKGWQIQAEGF